MSQMLFRPALPRHLILLEVESARWTRCIHGSEPHDASSSLFHCAVSGVAVEVSRRLARVGGIDLDASAGQVFGKGQGHGVQRSLGAVVAKVIDAKEHVVRIRQPAQ